MVVQHFPAPPDLLPFVSGYLYGHSLSATLQHQPNIPRGMPALMIVMGGNGSGQVQFMHPSVPEPLKNGIYLFGQFSQTVWMNVSLTQAYMVALKPTALESLMGESASVVANRIVRVDDLLPDCRFLAEQLSEAQSQFRQLSLLDTVLRRLFRGIATNPGEVDAALHRIVQTAGQVRIRVLSEQERISTRSLTRKFTEQVGMSPKQYGQIIRFRSVMNYLLTHPGVSWLDIVYRFGYHDQSHLIKDFQHITGMSPAHYLTVDQGFDGPFINAISAGW